MAQQQAAPAAPPQVNMVVVNGLADLLPDSYSGDDMSTDIKEFFGRYRQWLNIHQNRFANNAKRVTAIRYILSGTALEWFNEIPAANMPATVNDLQHDFFAKFRIAKTRQEWKKRNRTMQIHARYQYPAHDKQVSTNLLEITVPALDTIIMGMIGQIVDLVKHLYRRVTAPTSLSTGLYHKHSVEHIFYRGFEHSICAASKRHWANM